MTIPRYLRDKLLEIARFAAQNSYSPYSKFPVGAALLADDGRVFTGCNVENASFGLTRCAEQVAFCKAVSEGSKGFLALAVVSKGAVTPCGSCRQMLIELCPPEMPIFLADLKDGSPRRTTLGRLMPEVFRLPVARKGS
ncbi:MAG: cytidine deaminase [Kiritimatiellia bacterium]